MFNRDHCRLEMTTTVGMYCDAISAVIECLWLRSVCAVGVSMGSCGCE